MNSLTEFGNVSEQTKTRLPILVKMMIPLITALRLHFQLFSTGNQEFMFNNANGEKSSSYLFTADSQGLLYNIHSVSYLRMNLLLTVGFHLIASFISFQNSSLVT